MRTTLVLLALFASLAFTHVPVAHADGDDAADDRDHDAAPWLPPELPAASATAPATACGRCTADAPAIRDVVADALAAAGLADDPTDSWVRRARWSAVIPWISVRAGRTDSWKDPDPDLVGRNQTFEVRATWRLDRLAFDGRELQVASFAAARHRERRRVATRVIRVYFTWLRARQQTDVASDLRWTLVADEAAAELDALTDGQFSARIHR